MAPANDFPVGYKFHPRDEELVGYYLSNKVRGAPFRDENVIPDIDLYGSTEARDIWNNNGGQNLGKDEDLYFFTKLKPTSSNGTGSRVARTIGSGTWHGQNSGTKVKDPKTKKTIGWWKRFTYVVGSWLNTVRLYQLPLVDVRLHQLPLIDHDWLY